LTLPAVHAGRASPFGSDLALRAVSALVLAVVAFTGAWFGGWLAGLVVAAAIVVVHLEWIGLTGDQHRPMLLFTSGLVVAVAVATAGFPGSALILVLALIVTAGATSRDPWRPSGVGYAATLGFGVLLICLSPAFSRTATVFLLIVVSATDTGAFFAGRLIGGARLWPALSPNKTWAGAIGGLVAGVVAGGIVAEVAGLPMSWVLLAVAFALALVAEGGDLFESWVKRRFGAKDSGRLVPGHGGFMDRVDGLTAAAGLAALIGWLHGGAGNIAGGLVAW
jgi:phosphatidate cytidylyltransferase